MSRKQLAALFLCNLVPFFLGNALLPLLPVYVSHLGADATITGLYLGLSFAALAAGALMSGWLSDRFQRRKAMIIMNGVLSLICIFWMGHVTDIWQLLLLTMIVWFCGGIGTSMVNILTGLYAPAQERGRIFGIIALTLGAGQFLGGLVSGRIVDRWGYEALFDVVALTQIIVITSGLFLEDKRVVSSQVANKQTPKVPLVVWLLMLASVLLYILNFSAGLGVSLSMNRLGFDATDISSTGVVAGLIALPLPLVSGKLSDRFDRRYLLAACCFSPIIGTLMLSSAGLLWHFWLAQVLFAGAAASASVGPALITDIASPEVLGSALARYNSGAWIGGVIGYFCAGVVIQNWGIQTTFSAGAILPILAILIILFWVMPQYKLKPQPAKSTVE